MCEKEIQLIAIIYLFDFVCGTQNLVSSFDFQEGHLDNPVHGTPRILKGCVFWMTPWFCNSGRTSLQMNFVLAIVVIQKRQQIQRKKQKHHFFHITTPMRNKWVRNCSQFSRHTCGPDVHTWRALTPATRIGFGYHTASIRCSCQAPGNVHWPWPSH